MVESESKAITAVAETAGKAIDATRELGGFVSKILGTGPEDAAGLLGVDLLGHLRIRNAHRLQIHTDEILAKRQAEIEPLSLSVAKPLMEAAQDESREEILALWARLLANALDNTRPAIRKSFIEALSRFDPLDVLIMERTFRIYVDDSGEIMDHDELPSLLGVSLDEFSVSIKNLYDLGCIETPLDDPVWGEEEGVPVLKDVHVLTAFGRELMKACSP